MSSGWPRRIAVAAMVAALVGCTGCTNIGYYWQAATGHVDLMRAARPVPEWLQDPDASQALKDKLLLAQRIRHYASADLGLPDHVPNYEPAGGSAEFPLAMISPPARNFLNSTFVNVTSLRAIEGEPLLEIHAADAAARGIADGATVRVFNARGEHRCRAEISRRAR